MAAEGFNFTCTTCSLAFSDSAVQRAHFSDDLHRYNSKRRVAGLPPVNATVFNEKVLTKRAEAQDVANERIKCEVCSKSFLSDNAYQDHLRSKKHKEALNKPSRPAASRMETESDAHTQFVAPPSSNDEGAVQAWLTQVAQVPRLTCLFCPTVCESMEHKLSHMLDVHGFFLPDQDYLIDVEGLIAHAAEEIGVYNTCLYCGAVFGTYVEEESANAAQAEVKRAQRGLEAVRKHMNDKSHCKLRWDTEEEQLEWSDYYDFTSTYTDAGGAEEGWEDTDEMVLDEEAQDAIEVDHKGRPVGLPPPKPTLRYGDTEYELILPSGARIGHRALRHIYRQNQVPYMNGTSRQSRAARRLADNTSGSSSSALVPVAGGMGQFGRGNQVVKAKSTGDAKFAQKATREFAESRARAAHATRVAIKVHNHQKHYRDPLLQ